MSHATRKSDGTNLLNILTACCFLLLLQSIGCTSPVTKPGLTSGEDPRSGYITNPNGEPVIVFVHGVTGNSVTAWTNDSTKTYFPHLLAGEIPSSSIYTISYPSPRLSSASTISEIASRTLQTLKDDGVFKNHKRVYFIAHSMGGLVTKAMFAELNRSNYDNVEILKRVRAVIYLSTPAQGSHLAEYASWLSANPQLADMKPADLNSFLQTIENAWQNLLRDRDQSGSNYPKSYCAYETLPDRHGSVVVPRVYAATRCDMNLFPVDASHSEIAKPASKQETVFKWVLARIRETEAFPKTGDSTGGEEFKKEKFTRLTTLKETLSRTQFKLDPDERQEINKGTKKGTEILVRVIDQVVKTFDQQSAMYDSHQHLFSESRRTKLNEMRSDATKLYGSVHEGISNTMAQKQGSIGEQNALLLKQMLVSMTNFITELSNLTTQELNSLFSQGS